MFFGSHIPELVVLLLAALVIFGPRRLPAIGSAMGKGIREFRKSTSDAVQGDVHLPDPEDHTTKHGQSV